MNTKRIIAAVMIASMAMTTAACNDTTQGFSAGVAEGSNNGSSTGGGSQLEDIKTEELDAELDALEKAMAELQAELSNISVLSLTSEASGVQSKSIDDKLKESLRKVFDAVGKGVDKAKAKSAELRAKVNVQLSKLDPLNPLHIALVMKLADLNKYLDRLDGEIASAVDRAADFVDAKVADLDAAVAKLDPKNPLSIIAMIYWANIKQTIVECNAALRAKI